MILLSNIELTLQQYQSWSINFLPLKKLSAMKSTKLFLLLLFIISFQTVLAQNITGFKLRNAVDNKEISLMDFADAKAVVVVFTSNYCPYSKLYEDRIAEFHRQYAERGVNIILINPNDPTKSANDSMERMAKKAIDNNFKYPYLADDNQKVTKLFGARKTPEVFILKKSGTQFKTVYQGAIDDNPQVPQDVSHHYVAEALDEILSGKLVTTKTTRATGCIIKKR